MTKDTSLILFGIIAVVFVILVDKGAGERWCNAYPEWCNEQQVGR